MQKSVAAKLSSDDEAELKAAIRECDAAIVRAFKRIRKNQQAIDKLKKETRVILDAIKAA